MRQTSMRWKLKATAILEIRLDSLHSRVFPRHVPPRRESQKEKINTWKQTIKSVKRSSVLKVFFTTRRTFLYLYMSRTFLDTPSLHLHLRTSETVVCLFPNENTERESVDLKGSCVKSATFRLHLKPSNYLWSIAPVELCVLETISFETEQSSHWMMNTEINLSKILTYLFHLKAICPVVREINIFLCNAGASINFKSRETRNGWGVGKRNLESQFLVKRCLGSWFYTTLPFMALVLTKRDVRIRYCQIFSSHTSNFSSLAHVELDSISLSPLWEFSSRWSAWSWGLLR